MTLRSDRARSIPEAERQVYGASYSRPGRMRATWAYFVSFQQAATDFATFSQTKLTMPVLSISGEKANGDALARQIRLVATNATSVVLPNTGHCVMHENPSGTTDALMRFLGTASTASALPPMRMTPAEVNANQTGWEQIGSSGLAGVSTKVLFGDPSNAGFSTIVLFGAPHTTIPAHSHRDDRMATVVAGTWQIRRAIEVAFSELLPR